MTRSTSTPGAEKLETGRAGPRRAKWVVSTTYVLTSPLIAGWCGYVFLFHSPAAQLRGFTEDDKLPDAFASAQLQILGIALLLTATQLVFLVPFARHRIHRGANGIVIALLIGIAGLQMLFVGWLGLLGGLGLKPGEKFPILSWAATTFAYAAPAISLAIGATVVGLSIARPPRPRVAISALIAMLLLLTFALPLTGINA